MGDSARVLLRPLNEIITLTSCNTALKCFLKETNKEKVTKELIKKQKDKETERKKEQRTEK